MGLSLKSILGGAAQIAGGIGSQVATVVRRGANITSGVLTGNTDKIQSNLSLLGSETVQNLKAQTGGILQMQSGGLIQSNQENSMQKEKRVAGEAAAAEQAKADAEEAARPERERQTLLNQQYQNQLMKSGKRTYSTLLGGGF